MGLQAAMHVLAADQQVQGPLLGILQLLQQGCMAPPGLPGRLLVPGGSLQRKQLL